MSFVTHASLVEDRVPRGASYPFDIPSVRSLSRLELHPAVTYFVGDNGSGKSTILEAIAVACGLNAEGGSENEPEAALAPSRQLAFLARLHELVGEGSPFVIATHAPIVLAYPDAFIYQCSFSAIRWRTWPGCSIPNRAGARPRAMVCEDIPCNRRFRLRGSPRGS